MAQCENKNTHYKFVCHNEIKLIFKYSHGKGENKIRLCIAFIQTIEFLN